VAIVLTYHALERMTLRAISESMIEEAIFTPDETGRGYEEKLLAFKAFAGRRLKVVYSVEGSDHIIISAVWED